MKKIVLKRTSLTLADIEESRLAIRYREELNDAQYEAVCHREGPALVIAGAGTGKTRTLTYRVARLIELGTPPRSIVLLTFTRKAAREMLRRAALLLDSRTEQVTGGTFHSYANLLLRKHAERIGYQPNFTILDQGDSEDVVNLLRAKSGFATTVKRFPLKQTLWKMISMSINTLTPISSVVTREQPQFAEQIDMIEALAQAYVAYKKRHNLMDYDDMLVNLVFLLERHEDVRARIGRDISFLMVDEYQDTNALQARIVQLLAGPGRNVMVVGDDSQSIYSFRGADFRNIMDFPRQFQGCRVITLEENYRSTQPVLDFTNEVISRASEKYSKTLFTSRTEGERPAIISALSETEQSQFIVQRVLELREEGTALKDMAVLFRAGYHSFDLEIELTRAGVPFVKFGGLKLMDTAHIKDVIAHLRVIDNPRDIISWTRILLLITGIGPRGAERITDAIQDGLNPLVAGADERISQIVRVAGIAGLLAALRHAAAEHITAGERIARLMNHYQPILKDTHDDFQKRMKDLDMFASIAERYTSLPVFLADMALEPPNDSVADLGPEGTEREFLTLSTVHSAKGLEWTTVFVMHLVEGRFPMAAAAGSFDDMEEERRLFYVACTRAKRNLYLTYPVRMYERFSGNTLSDPSRFISEMPDELVERYMVE
jgi:DNA helicase-2/ATP-dependent DNA helicase PcrA